jgi:hypothetical protein
VKSLAMTSNVDFVEVMSHDLYGPGTEHVMEQATMVMDALAMLTGTVILFDEFEPILHVRTRRPVRITEMLTGNMLPKFDALYKAAGQNRIAYVMATNHVERLDSAAIRVGRFDRMRLIYYPDPASRACRLASELRLLLKRLDDAGLLPENLDGADQRLTNVVAMTAKCYINRLCITGWFSAPSKITTVTIDEISGKRQIIISPQSEDKLTPVWRYIMTGEESKLIDWSLFGSAKSTSGAAAAVAGEDEPEDQNKAQDEDKLTMERRLENVVKVVKEHDEALRNAVKANAHFTWDEMLILLTQKFEERKGDRRVHPPKYNYHERRFRGERRWSASAATA